MVRNDSRAGARARGSFPSLDVWRAATFLPFSLASGSGPVEERGCVGCIRGFEGFLPNVSIHQVIRYQRSTSGPIEQIELIRYASLTWNGIVRVHFGIWWSGWKASSVPTGVSKGLHTRCIDEAAHLMLLSIALPLRLFSEISSSTCGIFPSET